MAVLFLDLCAVIGLPNLYLFSFYFWEAFGYVVPSLVTHPLPGTQFISRISHDFKSYNYSAKWHDYYSWIILHRWSVQSVLYFLWKEILCSTARQFRNSDMRKWLLSGKNFM